MLINKQIKSRVDLIVSNVNEILNETFIEKRDKNKYTLVVSGLKLTLDYLPEIFYAARRNHYTKLHSRINECYAMILGFLRMQDDYINESILLEIIDLFNMITPPKKTYSLEEIMNIFNGPNSWEEWIKENPSIFKDLGWPPEDFKK